MINLKNKIRIAFLPMITAAVLLASCNKDVKQFDIPAPAAQTGISLDSTLRATANDSLYYLLIKKASLGPTNYINLLKATTVTNQYTVFVPDNNAMKLFTNAISGGLVPLAAPDAVFAGFINSANIPVASAVGIVSYNIVPQVYDTASISSDFPNMQVGTLIQLAPTTAPFITATTFPSKRPGILRVNNIPMTSPLNVRAYNGIIHHVATVVGPPQRVIWERLNTDNDLTIFKAAIARADSGTAAPGTIVGALQTGPANLTVFAPTNLAMKQFISAATGGLIPVAAPDANFIGFLGSNLITTQLVKGIVVYHLFDDRSGTLSPVVVRKRPGRVFTPNLLTGPNSYFTVLNSADSVGVSFPPVIITATFTGAFVSAATIKGNANPTPSNLLINVTYTPDISPTYGTTPVNVNYAGTNDQQYVNGVLHKIDQVLRPL